MWYECVGFPTHVAIYNPSFGGGLFLAGEGPGFGKVRREAVTVPPHLGGRARAFQIPPDGLAALAINHDDKGSWRGGFHKSGVFHYSGWPFDVAATVRAGEVAIAFLGGQGFGLLTRALPVQESLGAGDLAFHFWFQANALTWAEVGFAGG